MTYKADNAPYYTFDHGDDVIFTTYRNQRIIGTFHARVMKNMKEYYIVEYKEMISPGLSKVLHCWVEPENVIPYNSKKDKNNPNNTFKRVV